MKAMFIFMCIICAISLSILGAIIKTGRVPYHEPPTPVVVKEETIEPAQGLTVFTEGGKAVEQLVAALKTERASYEKRLQDLAVREEELKFQESLLQDMTDTLDRMQVDLDTRVLRIEEAEKANLRRLADICGKMDAAAAATSLAEMEKKRAAMILSLMNERNAAGIMDAAVGEGPDGPALVAEWVDIIRRLNNDNSQTAQAEQGT